MEELDKKCLETAATTLGLAVVRDRFHTNGPRRLRFLHKVRSQRPIPALAQRPLLRPAAFRLAALAVAARDDDNDAAIVGMWEGAICV